MCNINLICRFNFHLFVFIRKRQVYVQLLSDGHFVIFLTGGYKYPVYNYLGSIQWGGRGLRGSYHPPPPKKKFHLYSANYYREGPTLVSKSTLNALHGLKWPEILLYIIKKLKFPWGSIPQDPPNYRPK